MKVPFRVQFEESAANALKSLSQAQQKTVDRKLAAAADFAALREHNPSDDWVEIHAGPVVLECRSDAGRRLLTVVSARKSTRLRARTG